MSARTRTYLILAALVIGGFALAALAAGTAILAMGLAGLAVAVLALWLVWQTSGRSKDTGTDSTPRSETPPGAPPPGR